MFGLPWLGTRLAIAHYIGSFAVGLLFKLHGRGEVRDSPASPPGGNILGRALRAMIKARRDDGRPFGRLLGDAVSDSVKTLLMIGGFIMVFSVLLRITHVAGLAPLLTAPIGWLLQLLHIDPGLADATLQGIFEVDLGAVAASQAPSPLLQRALIASFIIGWSGLSVHGQVASALSGTDIRMGPYVFARVLHGVIAAIVTVFLINGAAPALAPVVTGPVRDVLGHVVVQGLPPFWQHLQLSAMKALLIPGVLLAVALLGALPPTLQVIWWRLRR